MQVFFARALSADLSAVARGAKAEARSAKAEARTVHFERCRTTVWHVGDFFAEIRGTWPLGKNGGTERVRLIVIDQVPAGTATNTVMKP